MPIGWRARCLGTLSVVSNSGRYVESISSMSRTFPWRSADLLDNQIALAVLVKIILKAVVQKVSGLEG